MKKFLLFGLLSLFAIFSSHGQEPFIKNNGIFSYYSESAPPASDWNQLNFDDSGWLSADTAIIGYGWPKLKAKTGLDSIPIVPASNLYLRIKFNVEDPYKYQDLNFSADYDDGFVIYLNGAEIARKNLGKAGSPIPADMLATRSHEASTYTNYFAPVNGIYIDSTIVRQNLKKGENVFAIRVVNDSINGSDLSFLANVYNIQELTPRWNYASSWVKYFRQMELDSSEFPIIFINTDEYGMPYIADNPKLNIFERVKAKMAIIDNKDKWNKIDDPITFNGDITIERRGQTSKDFPKMCYRLETVNPDGTNMDTSIMGMPSDNDWILLSNYGDKTMIRNELTFYIGRRLDHYEPRTRNCELILNGEFIGLYTFVEKIKRGKERVSVAKRDSINPEDGGFVLKYDKGAGTGVVQYVYPKADEVTATEKSYINNFMRSYVNALNSSYFMTDSGYKKYMSPKSMVDYVLINELTKNCDAYFISSYFHKDKNSKDGRLKYGPLWDYDIAYQGARWQDGDKIEGWQFAQSQIGDPMYVKKIFKDTAVTHFYANRWKYLRKSFLADEKLFAIIDSLAENIKDSRIRNYNVWPIIDKQYVWPVIATYTYEDDINVIKNFLTKRMKWIDNNIDKVYYPLDIEQLTYGKTMAYAYPNPFISRITVEFLGNGDKYSVILQSVDGRRIASKEVSSLTNELVSVEFSNGTIQSLSPGMYFASILQKGKLIQTVKVLKDRK